MGRYTTPESQDKINKIKKVHNFDSPEYEEQPTDYESQSVRSENIT